jgi:hypothetical protein
MHRHLDRGTGIHIILADVRRELHPPTRDNAPVFHLETSSTTAE